MMNATLGIVHLGCHQDGDAKLVVGSSLQLWKKILMGTRSWRNICLAKPMVLLMEKKKKVREESPDFPKGWKEIGRRQKQMWENEHVPCS